MKHVVVHNRCTRQLVRVVRRWIDDGDIVGDVIDVADIARVGWVVRQVVFARGEWKPADRWARANRKTDPGTVEPRHQRGRVYRMMPIRPRPPGPALVRGNVHPATVMERCEAPRRIIDPGPAPGLNMCPMTVSIRCPFPEHRARCPEPAIVAVIDPVAILIKIFVAGHIWRNDAFAHVARVGLIPIQIARLGPLVESRFQRRLKAKIGCFYGAAHDERFARLHADTIVAILKSRPPEKYRHTGFSTLRNGIHAVAAVGVEHQPAFIGHYRKNVTCAVAVAAVLAVVIAQPQVEAAALQESLLLVILQAHDIEHRFLVNPQRRRADPNFCATADLGPKRVFTRDRKIELGRAPAFAAVLEE